jgi:aspartyl-tRNA(Asn)/glutamyl-tRNA(Gln) amidotransferase subunit B
MEQGSLRCDVNVSLNRPGQPWGTRTETKNVNSLRSVERAVRYEMCRQAAVLDGGGRIVQETRHYHEDTGVTTAGRSKEEATDYRYFPEPDLVPVAPDPGWVAEIRAGLPELPATRRTRLAAELGATPADMQAMANAGVTDLVAETAAAGAPAGEARKWWLGYLAQLANAAELEPAELRIEPAQVAEVIGLVADGTLSDGLARQVVDAVLETGQQPAAIVAERGLRRVSDADTLGAAVDEAIAAQPDIVAKIRGGKVQAAGPLVGAVMRATRGQADPALVRKLVLARLGVEE